jgi:hypothetical protein
MLVAQQKKKDNIIEYILYMWQVEDLIRSFDFKIEAINAAIISTSVPDPDLANKVQEWYEGLIQEMGQLKIEKKGHVSAVTEVIVELHYLHNLLINILQDEKYKEYFEAALPSIKDFKVLSQTPDLNEVETCINGMYAKLLMKLQQKEISGETEAAFTTFRNVLAYLADQYKKMQKGELNFQNN